MDLWIQSFWCAGLIYSAFMCIETFRFEPPPMRVVGMVAFIIAFIASIIQLNELVRLLHQYPPSGKWSLLELVPVSIALWRQLPNCKVRIRGR